MPSNLNALVRYKTINSCLYGGRRKWSIDELIDACSDALGESRGRYERISERTIRDDLRVMRSDILGFNAPIKQEKGLYYYDDPHYSIMSIGITDLALVERIIKMLLDIRDEVKHPELEIVLQRLLKISPEAGIRVEETNLLAGMTHLHDIEEEPKEKLKKKDIAPRKAPVAKSILSQPSAPEESDLLFSMPGAGPITILWGDLLGTI